MSPDDELLRWARKTSDRFMVSLGRRALHVRQAAALAHEVGLAMSGEPAVLAAAAWLHDIGYSNELVRTGFHPLDGARWLRTQDQEELALLVAHHSGARHEAVLRGIDGYLEEFPYRGSDLDLALTYCDLTTGPDGRRVTLECRIEEIHERYGQDHVVSRTMRIGLPEFEKARESTERLIAEAGIQLSGSLAYPDSGSR